MRIEDYQKRKQELRDLEEKEFPGGVSAADSKGQNQTGIPKRAYGEKITQFETSKGGLLPPNEEIGKKQKNEKKEEASN